MEFYLADSQKTGGWTHSHFLPLLMQSKRKDSSAFFNQYLPANLDLEHSRGWMSESLSIEAQTSPLQLCYSNISIFELECELPLCSLSLSLSLSGYPQEKEKIEILFYLTDSVVTSKQEIFELARINSPIPPIPASQPLSRLQKDVNLLFLFLLQDWLLFSFTVLARYGCALSVWQIFLLIPWKRGKLEKSSQFQWKYRINPSESVESTFSTLIWWTG